MNIMENKRVTAIALLMAIAFGGICHYSYGRYQALKAAEAEIAQEKSKLDGYADEELPPTRENSRLLVQASDSIEGLAADLRRTMEAYAKSCASLGKDAQGQAIAPDRFQKEVNDMTAKVAAYAAERKCGLSADAAALGLNEYKTASATERDAPYLNFLLHAADRLVRHVVDSGAPAVKRLYCAPLPEEQVGAKRQPDFFPLELEITFTARASAADIDTTKEETLSVLPRVINALNGDKSFFFTITGFSVKTASNLPMLAPYRASSKQPAGVDPMQGQQKSGATSASPVAQQLTGAADSSVDVSLTLQVLYFTKDKLSNKH